MIQNFEDVAPSARLLSVALQSCLGLRQEVSAAAATAAGADAAPSAAAAAAAAMMAPIDAALPAIVDIAIDRLQGLKKRTLDPATGVVSERRGPHPPKSLREVLLRLVADALSYDAAATLNAIGAATGAGPDGVAKFFEVWITLLTATKAVEQKGTKSGDGGGGGGGASPQLENFKKLADKKSAVLGLAAALSAPPGSLPPAVEAGAAHVLAAAMGLLSAWKEQRAKREKESGGNGGGATRSSSMPGWGNSDSDDDEDEDQEEDAEAAVQRLAAAAAKRAEKVAAGGGGESDDDDDDSDDDYDGSWDSSDSDAGDDDEAESPLAGVDPRAVLLSSVTVARQIGRLAGIEHDLAMRGALEALAAEVGGGGAGEAPREA